MHRRTLLRSLAGAALFPTLPRLVTAQEIPGATPDALPRHHGLPRPVALGQGIELIDYRIYPSTDVPRIIGEIVNIGDETVDAPVVSVVFPDLSVDGLAYAPPFLPAMKPGQSNLIFGVLPPEIDSEEKLATADFGLCAPVRPGEYSERLRGVDLQVMIEMEGYWADSFNVVGTVQNVGTDTVTAAAVNGMVRDRNGRYIGVASEVQFGDLPPGEVREFTLWAWTASSSTADPYIFLQGDTDYSVEVSPGVTKPILQPGCPAILPWNSTED